MNAPMIGAPQSTNKTLNLIAVGITITVGIFTIVYLVNHTKLIKRQLADHEKKMHSGSDGG